MRTGASSDWYTKSFSPVVFLKQLEVVISIAQISSLLAPETKLMRTDARVTIGIELLGALWYWAGGGINPTAIRSLLLHLRGRPWGML